MADVPGKLKTREYTHSLRFAIEERSPERARGRMPIADGMLNPFGTVHAGALLWFADVVATVCAIGETTVGPEGQGFPLAVTLNAQLLGNRRSGELIAEARPVRRGKRLIVVRTEVKDADGALLLDVTTTHMPA